MCFRERQGKRGNRQCVFVRETEEESKRERGESVCLNTSITETRNDRERRGCVYVKRWIEIRSVRMEESGKLVCTVASQPLVYNKAASAGNKRGNCTATLHNDTILVVY